MPQMHRYLSPIRMTIAKNTVAQIVGRLVSSLASLVLTIYVARMYGSLGYGDFVKITTFVSFFYLLVDFGFNAIYIQKSSLHNEKEIQKHDPFWEQLVVIRTILGIILVIVASCIVFILPAGADHGYTQIVRVGIFLLLPTIFFQGMITSANALFQNIFRYEWSAVSVGLGSIVSFLMIGGFAMQIEKPPFIMSITPLLVGSASTAIIGLWYVFKTVSFRSISFAWPAYRDYFLATLPLGLTLLCNVIYFHVDSVILTLTRSTQEVGIYGLAYKVFELTLVFPTFFMNAMYPMMIEKIRNSKLENQNSLRKIIYKSALFLLLTSLLLSLIIWFGAPFLTYVKQDFISSIVPLRILVLGLPLFFLSSLMMWVLIAQKKQWTLAYIYGGSMIVNIFLNTFFVPENGYIAAAWITVVSEGLVLLVSGGVVARELKIWNNDLGLKIKDL